MNVKSRPYKTLLTLVFTLICANQGRTQDASFMVLGDMHYDRLDLHDWDYVMTRPQDFRQIMNEYPQFTAVYMPPFLEIIREQTVEHLPRVGAVAQLGDLVEGVAGTELLSYEMDKGALEMLCASGISVPWVLVKGNHDVSNSPGQPEAWREVVKPFMESQMNKSVDDGMYTFRLAGHTELFVLDQFFSTDRGRQEEEMVNWLEEKLDHSNAKFKFILTHQPVIPVTDRCWHLLSGIRRKVDDPGIRNRFLSMLGKHKAIVLCAHLHKFSVLRRDTDAGPIIQVMINSVNSSFEATPAGEAETAYGASDFITGNETFQTSTLNLRRVILENEEKYVRNFLRTDLPGYAIIDISEDEDTVMFSYYGGFSKNPYCRINLTALQAKQE